MKTACLRICALVLTLLACKLAMAGTTGSFRGTVVEAPTGEPSAGWIYVQGRNGSLRRVQVSRARVIYGEAVPLSQREKAPKASLVLGAEVRVTAEQDGSGEWQASQVEILKLRNARMHAERRGP